MMLRTAPPLGCSVFIGQQYRRGGPVGLRDDVQPGPFCRRVGREKAAAVLQGLVVQSLVLVVEAAPIARHVANQEGPGRLAAITDSGKRPRRADEPPQLELHA